MKIIFKIARAELRTLFYSPIAWITLVVFFVISASQFVDPLVSHANIQDQKLLNSPGWLGFKGPLTLKMFMQTIGSFSSYLYMFIPLLTMGVINREETTGTMKLLTSSPIRIREIVLGKFAGLMVFNLVLSLLIALLLYTGFFSIEHAEFKWYFSMVLGYFLLTGAYMAIGLFISCLTSYQIVAGIGTFIAFYILGMIGKLWQEYDFIRDLTWFLSMKGRIEPFIYGLITTREIFYFSLIIVLFLGLSIIKLKSRQESKKWTISFFRYSALIVIIVLAGYFSARPGYVGYLDVTRDKLRTIDTATQAVLRELDGSPITVTLYGNLLGLNAASAMPALRNEYIWDFWEQYIRFYPNIRFRYVNYYGVAKKDSSLIKNFPGKSVDEVAIQFAKFFKKDTSYFLKQKEIGKYVDLSGEDEMKALMELEYKGKKAFLRTYQMPTWPLDPNVSASIRKLTRPSLPKIMFTTGHYERSPWRNGEREFGGHTNKQNESRAMVNMGMDADTISLLTKDIPENTDILVVADPRSELAPVEIEKINGYIAAGGNAIFYGEPGKQQMLNPVLNPIGINLDNGTIVQPRKHVPSDYQGVALNMTGNKMAREDDMQLAQRGWNVSAGGMINGGCNISFSDMAGFKAESIMPLKADSGLWIEKGVYKEDSAKPTFSESDGDYRLPEYTIGVRLSRKAANKEQRIVVFSDADLMAVKNSDGSGIGLGMYSWLNYNEYPVYKTKVVPLDIRLSINKSTATTIWYLYVYILPAMLLITGAVILIRRKRK
ncbi:ABC transporter permease subunit [Pseudobacter ginsenosidimutans]|uniref:ABC-2 type transport system permease protein n=1 Tax=Pseudobacter ginsenosidimutans TaxID=661488 RepID=A0A4Q7MVC1_9BACT|nr:Gldg family protein [Pseudobacter ginsenosidimutans]QEC42108.1 ABC transporter permease subunit [Pseudobacter ginsenosidimutans]RZS71053.1 ABC-2 type transport system permease protein [Pseudobacter ginsenosidimutans]